MRSLEAIGVLEKDDDKGGRRITQSGQRDLDRESFFFCPQALLFRWRIPRVLLELQVALPGERNTLILLEDLTSPSLTETPTGIALSTVQADDDEDDE